ncbi:MAG: phosphatidylglycerophosphatase A [Candidatus Zixiibacteriota bacterium]|nr:MAG: phosphatidylglycerophosphatase A [candidate division Zixibacteria bacterium]
MKSTIIKCIATGLFIGHLKPYAGTWGTIPAWLIAYFLIGGHTPTLALICIGVTALSVWSATHAEKIYGHDARKIVIDEWAGMFVTLLWLPHSLAAYTAAFFAFRFWDVIKIPPMRQLERLPGGWGITADDIAAGIYANLTVRLILYVAEHYLDYALT